MATGKRHQAGIRKHLTSVASDTHRGYGSNISSLQPPPHTHQTSTMLNPTPQKTHYWLLLQDGWADDTHYKNETNKKMLDIFEERKLVKTFKHVTSCFRCLNVQPEKIPYNTADQSDEEEFLHQSTEKRRQPCFHPSLFGRNSSMLHDVCVT